MNPGAEEQGRQPSPPSTPHTTQGPGVSQRPGGAFPPPGPRGILQASLRRAANPRPGLREREAQGGVDMGGGLPFRAASYGAAPESWPDQEPFRGARGGDEGEARMDGGGRRGSSTEAGITYLGAPHPRSSGECCCCCHYCQAFSKSGLSHLCPPVFLLPLALPRLLPRCSSCSAGYKGPGFESPASRSRNVSPLQPREVRQGWLSQSYVFL